MPITCTRRGIGPTAVAVVLALLGSRDAVFGQQSEKAPAKPADAAERPAEKVKEPSDAQPSPTTPAQGDDARTMTWSTPSWVRDARWYEVDVAMFRNGEPSNDPVGCAPWTATPHGPKEAKKPDEAAPQAERSARLHFGGDLQGLSSKLGYLSRLGVNTLYLNSVFRRAGGVPGGGDVDMRHIDDSFGVAHSLSRITGESDGPETWKYSDTDKLFLDFLKEAHRKGFRVVLPGNFPELVSDKKSHGPLPPAVGALLHRWMDPDNDGSPSDGVDGWHAGDVRGIPLVEWRRQVFRLNPNAIIVGDARALAGEARGLDLVIASDIGESIRKFFTTAVTEGAAAKLVNELEKQQARYASMNVGVVTPLGGHQSGRLLPALASDPAKIDERGLARWRLANAVQHLCLGSPITPYGEEVGMFGDTASTGTIPMWWDDLAGKATKTARYRGDFVGLIRFLNAQREQYTPLRHGRFEKVIVDEKRSLVVFSRLASKEKALVAMNYGDQNQQVKLAVANPGQLARVIHTPLKPEPPRARGAKKPGSYDHTQIGRIKIAGSTQYATESGEISLWLGPESICIALLTADK